MKANGLKVVGTREDGKEIIGGIWQFMRNAKVPLSSVLVKIHQNGYAVGWEDFFINAPINVAGMLAENALTILNVSKERSNEILSRGREILKQRAATEAYTVETVVMG